MNYKNLRKNIRINITNKFNKFTQRKLGKIVKLPKIKIRLNLEFVNIDQEKRLKKFVESWKKIESM